MEPRQPIDPGILPPRRLDPRTILVRALPGLPSAIFAVPFILTAVQGEGLALIFALVGLALVMAVTGLISWLHWRGFTYEVLPDQLVISRGILNRTRRSIPAERIQDVSIKRSPVARVLGLAEVRIETGGGEADEGRLDSVSLDEAYRLRALLRGLKTRQAVAETAVKAEAEADVSSGDKETPLYRMALPRLLYFGLFNFSLVWIAAIFGAVQYLDQTQVFDWGRWLDLLDVAERELQARLNVMLAIGFVGLAVVLGIVVGIVRTVLRYHDFKLAFAEGRFRYSCGLLTRTEVVVAQRQIQLGLIERGAVSGRLGWGAFKVQTLGSSDHVSGRQELAPFARPTEIEPLVVHAGLPPFDQSLLRSVSRWHAAGACLGSVVLPAVIVLVASLYFPLAAGLLLVLPIPLGVSLLRPRFHGYALAETCLNVRRGVLKQRYWTVPYGNIQSVTVRRGLLQRWLGLATIRVDTAGGRGINGPHIHDLSDDKAAELALSLVHRIDASGTAENKIRFDNTPGLGDIS
jgi:putative membrane protein